jgi:hypothetical protein
VISYEGGGTCWEGGGLRPAVDAQQDLTTPANPQIHILLGKKWWKNYIINKKIIIIKKMITWLHAK